MLKLFVFVVNGIIPMIEKPLTETAAGMVRDSAFVKVRISLTIRAPAFIISPRSAESPGIFLRSSGEDFKIICITESNPCEDTL